MNKNELKDLLRNFRYQSLSGHGERGLMNHHIEALSDYLLPHFEIMEKRIQKLESSASWDGQHDYMGGHAGA